MILYYYTFDFEKVNYLFLKKNYYNCVLNYFTYQSFKIYFEIVHLLNYFLLIFKFTQNA